VSERVPNPAKASNADADPGIPGSATPEHPLDAIPLPPHGFARLEDPVQLASSPSAEVISRAAVVLLDAAGDRLGLTPGREPDLDMDEARHLVTALAGLLAASQEHLGDSWEPLYAGLRTLQNAFREASARPDAPGEGPGEHLLS
jgi:hypothetical protein